MTRRPPRRSPPAPAEVVRLLDAAAACLEGAGDRLHERGRPPTDLMRQALVRLHRAALVPLGREQVDVARRYARAVGAVRQALQLTTDAGSDAYAQQVLGLVERAHAITLRLLIDPGAHRADPYQPPAAPAGRRLPS